VIFKIQGSVWRKVLPFCLFNVAITAGIWILHKSLDIHLAFDGGLGYQYMSVLVSFFIVSNVNTAYNRFWEARGFLGKALNAACMLASRAALYSSHDQSDKAHIWRAALQNRLLELVEKSMYIVQHERAAAFNLMGKIVDPDSTPFQKHGLRKSIHIQKVNKLREDALTASESSLAVDAVIFTNGKYLDTPLKVQEKMELLGRMSAFMDAHSGLLKFSTTPRPFVIVQMGRTIIFAWVFLLPFAITTNIGDNLWESILLVFLVTYGFMGLTLAEIEMHDPLGNDENDLETDLHTNLIIVNIKDSLGANETEVTNLMSNAYRESGNYGSVESLSIA